MLKPAFARVLKRARYVGLEASEYLCRRYGWVQGSIVDFTPSGAFRSGRVLRRACNTSMIARRRVRWRTWGACRASRWIFQRSRSRTGAGIATARVPIAPSTCDPRRGIGARLQRNFYYLGLGVWIRKTETTIRCGVGMPDGRRHRLPSLRCAIPGVVFATLFLLMNAGGPGDLRGEAALFLRVLRGLCGRAFLFLRAVASLAVRRSDGGTRHVMARSQGRCLGAHTPVTAEPWTAAIPAGLG